MNSNEKTARVAGFLYLIVIITGVFAELFVRSSLIVPGNAGATAKNIMASESLFRIGFVSDLVAQVCFFLLALVLYVLLKPVSKNLAMLFVLLVSISVAITSINMLNQLAAVQLLSGADYLKAFSSGQLNALALFFLDLHKNGYLISQIFFGSWLIPLGYLVFKSGYFPRILGILLIVAAFGHLIDLFAQFLFPHYGAMVTSVVAAPIVIGEFSFCFWLLLKGARVP